MTAKQVTELLKRRQGKQSLRDFAKSLHVSAAYLSDIYRGRRDPGPKVLGYLSLEKIPAAPATYRYERTK